MTAEEQNLYNALITTFNGNLRFLSQYDYPLFERVNMLSDAINSGAYNERYFLEFVKENGDFDIYDSSTQTYIYDKKPKQWNNKLVVNTNLDLKGALILRRSRSADSFRLNCGIASPRGCGSSGAMRSAAGGLSDTGRQACGAGVAARGPGAALKFVYTADNLLEELGLD